MLVESKHKAGVKHDRLCHGVLPSLFLEGVCPKACVYSTSAPPLWDSPAPKKHLPPLWTESTCSVKVSVVLKFEELVSYPSLSPVSPYAFCTGPWPGQASDYPHIATLQDWHMAIRDIRRPESYSCHLAWKYNSDTNFKGPLWFFFVCLFVLRGLLKIRTGSHMLIYYCYQQSSSVETFWKIHNVQANVFIVN